MPPIKGRMMSKLDAIASVQQSTKFIRNVQKTTVAKRKVSVFNVNYGIACQTYLAYCHWVEVLMIETRLFIECPSFISTRVHQ